MWTTKAKVFCMPAHQINSLFVNNTLLFMVIITKKTINVDFIQKLALASMP